MMACCLSHFNIFNLNGTGGILVLGDGGDKFDKRFGVNEYWNWDRRMNNKRVILDNIVIYCHLLSSFCKNDFSLHWT